MSEMYQMISDGNRSDPFFWMEKRNKDELGKNKAVTPRLAFPFFLKTAEKQSNSGKKKKCAFDIMELLYCCQN